MHLHSGSEWQACLHMPHDQRAWTWYDAWGIYVIKQYRTIFSRAHLLK